jgi:serine/threonine-protein kinase HipA
MQRKDEEAGASYIELVDLLCSRATNTLADYEQLFRRVLLNIRIHNTDDHLRNHGFFVDKQGVRLSPVYDINPFVDRNELSRHRRNGCHLRCRSGDECYRTYGISKAQADAALKSVDTAVVSWED